MTILNETTGELLDDFVKLPELPPADPTTAQIEQEVIDALDELHGLQVAQDVARMNIADQIALVDGKINLVAGPLMQQRRALEDGLRHMQEELNLTQGGTKERLSGLVLHLGHGVKAEGGTASWVKPRITWDTKRLDGYAVVHPEIEQFRKTGKASVRVRVK